MKSNTDSDSGACDAVVESRKGPERFLGWLDLPVRYDKIEFAKVSECA